MKNVAIFYGSTMGTCEEVAKKIAAKLNDAALNYVTTLTEETVSAYDVLLLGTSTWGFGELQDDWLPVCDSLKKMNLSGKTIAMFCVGDCEGYPDSFCGALAPLYEAVKDTGATIIGKVSADDYHFTASEGVDDGMFLGLAIDEANESNKTDSRIDEWLKSLAL